MSQPEPSPASTAGARASEPYVVVARRYRPQTFTELVGQEHVGRALAGAINAQRVGHAYLFTGARGVGKTSAARILAKSLNCQQGTSPEPCGACDACLGIAAGSDVDVLEIDGASNRGIDEIRELRQNVNVRPSRSRYKIYIIDEVHMLTREAFNALLKTLEEPPEHVKFVFCTTEAEKIPITILSRCQRFDFAGIQSTAIAQRLTQIVEAEGVEAEPEALDLLARRAGGSMRDSQSLLEQLLSLGGRRLTTADVHALLGTADDRRIAELLRAMIEHDPGRALAQLDEAVAEGVDLGRLLEQLMGFLRDVMVASVGGGPQSLLSASAAEAETVAQAAARFRTPTVLAAIEIADHALGRLRYSTQTRTLVEAALVRLCLLDELDDLGALLAELRDGSPSAPAPRPTPGAGPARGPAAPPPPTAARSRTAPASPRGEASVSPRGEASVSPPGEASVSSTPAPQHQAPPAEAADSDPTGPTATTMAEPAEPAALVTPLIADSVAEVWAAALARVSHVLRGQAAMAEGVRLGGPDRLVVSFREKHHSCRSYLERAVNLPALEQALTAVAGTGLRLEFEMLPDSPAMQAVAAPPGPHSPAAREPSQTREDHPLVRKACELFEAQATWL